MDLTNFILFKYILLFVYRTKEEIPIGLKENQQDTKENKVCMITKYPILFLWNFIVFWSLVFKLAIFSSNISQVLYFD